ncbi:E3 ubiquitin/ISG15 ligase TRIM25-like isoform X1 [Erpetoichthys calabaricus]|uniref:E3 ubiquitin/ISG15 ligase TRIM25-like isoform X1 n=1 Tax=Erpetoichthys calabaricus TaxID=27687 RepID=UPI0022342DC4|nr:E3 ubiquitin/ISG15 ligase TRIM25-like isoform X1 [Erpetoichthys calabaricus]
MSESPFTSRPGTPAMSVDQCTCAVCQDVLKEPVTIPCGHNYCMKCINDYWDRERIYMCPQCRRTFILRPELNRNTVLTGLIENLKKARDRHALSVTYAGPDDVPCDVCEGRKRKASKTCMTCLISYCEPHLKHHRESAAFKKHKIEALNRNLEEKLCVKHHRLLEIFCRTEESCVCALCVATEHKSHDTVTLDMERARRQSDLENRKESLKKKIEDKEKKLEEMKETMMRIQRSAEREVQKHEETFETLLKLKSDVTNLIKEYEEREVEKAKDVIRQLEKEIMELKSRDAELTELLWTDDHIHFLQNFPSLCVPVEDEDAPVITVNRDFLPETLKKDLCDLKKHMEEMSGWEFVKTTEMDVDPPSYTLQNLKSRNGIGKYSCPLTLDPDTVNPRLHLSEDNKKVTDKGTVTLRRDHPDRFRFQPQVLCREALSGTRCYWEVEWSGDGGKIGVTYKGIGRKGKNEEFFLGCNDKSWCLVCSNSQCYVSHNGKNITICTLPSNKIGIYLDYSGGSLSFYSITNKMSLLYKFTVSFTEPLYPGFWVGRNASMKICQLNPSDQ